MDCGDCTVCCTLSVVKELNKKAWEQCSHCVNNGCEIYGKHPQECKDFECAYLQGGNNIELRPDKCGVMFFKNSDRIFTGVIVPDVEVTNTAKGQIDAFNKQRFSVIIFKLGEHKPMIMPAKGHNKVAIYAEYLTILKNGNL
jgi:hypothetical protein